MSNSSNKASTIIAEVHALLHTAESAKGTITYLDVNRICNHIASSHFPEGLPPAVKEAFERAAGECHPQKIERINKKGMLAGLGLISIGAVSGLMGAGLIALAGLAKLPQESLWTKLWRSIKSVGAAQPSPSAEINLLGILLAVVGIILVIGGVYLARKRSNPNFQASIAETILRDALTAWGSDSTGDSPMLPSKS